MAVVPFLLFPGAVLGDLAGPGWHGLDLVRAAHTLLPAEQGCFNGTLAWHDGHGALSSARHVPVEPRAVCAAVLVAEQMEMETACQAGLLALLPLHWIAYS